jgi:tetratricopeptide (TPR) repeat protein
MTDPELDAAEELVRAGHPEEALAALARLAAARPGDWLVVVRAARLLADLGRTVDAVAAADRAVALAPAEPGAHAGRGLVLAVLGRAAEGEDAAREALRLDPDHLGALHAAAVASAVAGRDERALAYGWHAVNVGPGDPAALRAYGTGLSASRRWSEAEQVWRSVLLAAPGDDEATRALITVLSAQGRHDYARELAEGLAAAYPARPDTAARAYRGDATWVAVAGGLVAAGLLLGHPGGFGPVGSVLLVLLGLVYGVARWRARRRVPATAETREAVARIDRARDRAVVGVAGLLAVLAGAGWLLRAPHTSAALALGVVLILGGLVGGLSWLRSR